MLDSNPEASNRDSLLNLLNSPRNPPMQTQQISKRTVYLCCTIKYSTRGEVEWQIQLSISLTPRAVFYRTATCNGGI